MKNQPPEVQTMNIYRVIKPRKADSENPIILRKGEKVLCSQESEEGDWAGWVFCESDHGEGWVPMQIVNRVEDLGTIIEDYNAREFDIEVDELINMEKELNGWIWGYKKDKPGISGWVPLNHLEEVEDLE